MKLEPEDMLVVLRALNIAIKKMQRDEAFDGFRYGESSPDWPRLEAEFDAFCRVKDKVSDNYFAETKQPRGTSAT